MIFYPKTREGRKRQEYYLALLRTVAPYIQIGLSVYIIWRLVHAN